MKIKENKKGKVVIDGFEVDGFISKKSAGKFEKCECGETTIFSFDHDDFFCPKCNKWIGRNCGDPECGFCKNKSEKPLPK
ncbi:hypothetical protein ACFLQI_01520 [Candidatus Undinarchaeota archaeon]